MKKIIHLQIKNQVMTSQKQKRSNTKESKHPSIIKLGIFKAAFQEAKLAPVLSEHKRG